DLTQPVIDKTHQIADRSTTSSRTPSAGCVIDGALVLRLGIDVLKLMQAVLLGGRSVAGASRQGGWKAGHWRTAFRPALAEIAAMAGIATDKRKRPPVSEAMR